MMRRLFCMACLMLPLTAQARPIIADLSEDTILIDESFTGKNILLFGARNDPGDIVVVLRGPLRDYTLRKKERVLGIWVNADQTKFHGVPDFYKVISKRPINAIMQEDMRRELGIGFDTIGMVPNHPLSDALAENFTQALTRRQEKKGLFLADDRNSLSFMGESLFKAPITFPDSIPRGVYTAEVYLFSDGQLAAMQSIPLSVTRNGFGALVADMSRAHPVLYGFLAVALALAIGWAGNHAFKKA